MNSFLHYLAEFGMLTDEQILERCSNGIGIDVKQELEMMAERDFCKSSCDIIQKLRILDEDKFNN